MPKIAATLVLIAALAALVLAQEPEAPAPAPETAPVDTKAEALKLIDQGRAAVVADEGQKAIDFLQKSIGLIQKGLEKGFGGALPAALADWLKGEVRTDSGSWGSGANAFQWMQASCKYTRKSDGLVVEVTISSSPQLIQGQRAMLEMYKSPQMRKMLEMDPNKTYEFIDEEAWTGWIVTDKTGGADLFALHDKLMVAIDVPKPEPGIAKGYWNGIDRKALTAK